MYSRLCLYVSRAICENLGVLVRRTSFRIQTKRDINIIASVSFWLSPPGRSTVRGNKISVFFCGYALDKILIILWL
jgi:hypothetical protein